MNQIILIMFSVISVIMLGSDAHAGRGAVAQKIPKNCAVDESQVDKIYPGVAYIQKKAKSKNINIHTRFVSDTGDFFQVVTDNAGKYGVSSSKGDFSAMVCATPNGITAHLGLNFIQSAVVKGKSSVKVTVVPVAQNTVQINSDLDGDVATNFRAM